MRIRSACVAVAASAFLLSNNCAAPQERAANQPTGRPNIVMAIADDWGWPHAGAYGDATISTPTFDRLAREGVLFEHAFVSSPSCTPSRGALLTGQHFFRLGEGANLWSNWPSGHPEYPAILEEAGYFVGSYRKGWGPGKHPGRRHNPAGRRFETTESFLKERPTNRPFALWFGTTDPHRPYRTGSGASSGIDPNEVHVFGHLPSTDPVQNDIADYYLEVQRFDRELGEFLDDLEALGELENTIVVMTGDHGMPFPRAKGNLYDAGTRIPLAIRWPGRIAEGSRIHELVSLVDLAPTFLHSAGELTPPEMTGRSLLPLLATAGAPRARQLADAKTSEDGEPRSEIVLGRERHVPAQAAPDSGGFPMRGLRTHEFLFIHNLRPDRWPAGTPDPESAFLPNAWLADVDDGPTKNYLWSLRNDPSMRHYYDQSFGRRSEFELYDLSIDPDQIANVAADPAFGATLKALKTTLQNRLKQLEDPRASDAPVLFDHSEYLGGAPSATSRPARNAKKLDRDVR